MTKKLSWFLSICLMMWWLGLTNAALGQTKAAPADEKLVAQLEEANKLIRDGKPLSACPILEDIVTSDPRQAAAKQALADCYVAVGKLLSASRTYEAIAKEAEAAGQEVVRKVAEDKRHALAPRLSHLRIVVPPSLQRVQGLMIVLDGEKLERAQWGEAYPADRGPHKVEALLLGDRVWSTVRDVFEEGATLDVEVDVHAPFLCVGQDCAPASDRKKKPEFWTKGRVAGVTLAAVGVAGLGVGAGFGAAAFSARNESNAGHCNERDECDPVGRDLRYESLGYGNVSTAMFVGGGILAGTGLILFAATAPKTEMRATVGIGPQGIVMRGQF